MFCGFKGPSRITTDSCPLTTVTLLNERVKPIETPLYLKKERKNKNEEEGVKNKNKRRSKAVQTKRGEDEEGEKKWNHLFKKIRNTNERVRENKFKKTSFKGRLTECQRIESPRSQLSSQTGCRFSRSLFAVGATLALQGRYQGRATVIQNPNWAIHTREMPR